MIKDITSLMVKCHYTFLTHFCSKLLTIKRNNKQRIESCLHAEKHNLLKMEKVALEKNAGISLYRSILQQNTTFYQIDFLKRSSENSQNINFLQTSRSFILNGFWQ